MRWCIQHMISTDNTSICRSARCTMAILMMILAFTRMTDHTVFPHYDILHKLKWVVWRWLYIWFDLKWLVISKLVFGWFSNCCHPRGNTCTCSHTTPNTSTLLARCILMVYILMYTWDGIYLYRRSIIMQFIRTSNIVGGGPHLQTQFYSTLYTPRWCLLSLIFYQSSIHTLTLHSTTMHP